MPGMHCLTQAVLLGMDKVPAGHGWHLLAEAAEAVAEAVAEDEAVEAEAEAVAVAEAEAEAVAEAAANNE